MEATIPTDEEKRLLRRIEDIRSMLRDASSLDLIETLLLALGDMEQRLAWAQGEDGFTPYLAAAESADQDANTPPATPEHPSPDTGGSGRARPPESRPSASTPAAN